MLEEQATQTNFNPHVAENLKLVRLDSDQLPAELQDRDNYAILVYNVNGGNGGGGVAESVTIANQPIKVIAKNVNFGIGEYDEIDFTYDSGNVTSAVYKNDGSTVGTLTYTYDNDGNITNIIKS
ncbi:MAG: hypothetical protein LAT55_13605 [Opitutales bacterium]|nr:hypothetical protein [Opitutales bacterium]